MIDYAFLSEAVCTALGWTLLHSLWQGTFIALIALFLLPRFQKASSRYAVAYSLLMGLLVCSMVTFGLVYEPISELHQGSTLKQPNPVQIPLQAPFSFQELERSIGDWVEENSTLLTTLWLLGFGFFLLRLLGGVWMLRSFRSKGLSSVPETWQLRFEALKSKAGFTKNIGFFESKKVQSPITLGHFKPIILFPIGLINQLSPEQVEAALAHELAHIVRRDFALNLLQSFIEALFYFHPAAWFLGNVIRKEREHCCDDLAMRLCPNSITYARALVEIERHQKQLERNPTLALAFAGSKKPALLQRVQRILNQPQQHDTQIMEKFIATLALLFCLAAWTIKAEPIEHFRAELGEIAEKTVKIFQNEDKNEPLPLQNAFVQPDTSEPKIIKKEVQKFKKDDGENEMELTLTNGEISELIVNGETIPQERYGEFEEMTKEFKGRTIETQGKTQRIVVVQTDDDMEWKDEDGNQMVIKKRTIRDGDEVRVEVEVEDGNDDAEVRVFQSGKGQTQTVRSQTDENGNVVVMVQDGNETTKIEVIDGKVFKNGKEIEGTHDVQGTDEGRRMIFVEENDDTEIIEIEEDGERHVIVMEGDDKRTWEERWEEISEELGERAEELEAEMRELWENRDDRMEEIRIRVETMTEKIENDIDRRIEERRMRRENSRQPMITQHDLDIGSGNVIAAFRAKLIEDKLIDVDDPFTLELTEKKMKLNKTKMSDAMHRSYIQFYEEVTGKEFGPESNLKLRDDYK